MSRFVGAWGVQDKPKTSRVHDKLGARNLLKLCRRIGQVFGQYGNVSLDEPEVFDHDNIPTFEENG